MAKCKCGCEFWHHEYDVDNGIVFCRSCETRGDECETKLQRSEEDDE